MKTYSLKLILGLILSASGLAFAPTSASAQTDVPVTAGDSAQTPTVAPAVSQDAPQPKVVPTASADPKLQFNFTGADWPTVLNWFASQADLSLQLDVVPSGSFSYIDPNRTYDVKEAMDVLNIALIKRGYIAVRRGRLLQMIDLEVENADKLISEIAELVRPDELESRGRSDVVSCVLPLGSMTPESAKEELGQLVGPWGLVLVLPSARQVKVTETADKLITIREVLRQTSEADTKVITVELEHRGAEELLEIARPLLGLEEGEFASDDLRLSIGPLGDRIYAIGQPVKTALLESFLKQADKPLASESEDGSIEPVVAELQTHVISIADSATVFDVLQTLLAGSPDTRISMEPNTNSVVAYAVPETHALIKKTIAELERNVMTLKVFNLKRLDPAQALLTINKYFGVAEGGRGPIVDGNPEDGKLWVRGTNDQIAAVEKLIDELEGNDPNALMDSRIRFLKIDPASSRDSIQRAIELWPITGRRNSIRALPPSGEIPRPGIPEVPARSRDDEEEETEELSELEDASWSPIDRRFHTLIGENGEDSPVSTQSGAEQEPEEIRIRTASGADIILQMTPAGLMLASEDTEALDEFEALLLSMTQEQTPSDLPTIFQLKHAEAEPTAELISAILGGAETSLGSAVNSATGGLGGGMLGGLLNLAGGGGGEEESTPVKNVLTTSGNVSIVPDARLNYLIVHAGPTDLAVIEMLLEKIDIPESPVDVQIRPEPLLIPVIHQEAADIAKTVKEVLGSRIEGQEDKKSGGGAPNPKDFIEAMRGGGRQATSEKTKSESPKINIAVNEKSNSLVVIASPQDFNEVRQLVELLDEGGASEAPTIATIQVGGNTNPDVMKSALESLFGSAVKTTGQPSSGAPGSSPASPPSSSSSSTSQTDADAQRRMEFYRALRERMESGGGSPFGGGDRGGRSSGGGDRGGSGGGGRPGR
jgi:type II secretory pathway component GspD/PulD (secretin)